MESSEYQQYLKLVNKLTKGSRHSNDLLHDVLIQLQTNKNWNSLPEKEKKFFFVRTIQNQFYSNNSQFQRTYKKYEFQELGTLEETETEYKERPTIEWVRETLEQELKDKPESWYNVGLFKMYMEHKKIDPIHKKTRIPKYSIRITIKEMKKWLNKKWEEENG